MTILRTQLRATSPGTNLWGDTAFANAARIIINHAGPGNFYVEDFTDAVPGNEHFEIQGDIIYFTDPTKISNGDSYDSVTHIYTFGDGKPNRFQSDTIPPILPPYPQERDENIATNQFGVDDQDNVFEYSRLTKVEGTGGISVTTDAERPGVVSIDGSSITPDFNDVALTGDTTAENLSVSGSTNVSALSVSGDTSMDGTLTINKNNFRPELQVYSDQESIPTEARFAGNTFFIRVNA